MLKKATVYYLYISKLIILGIVAYTQHCNVMPENKIGFVVWLISFAVFHFMKPLKPTMAVVFQYNNLESYQQKEIVTVKIVHYFQQALR